MARKHPIPLVVAAALLVVASNRSRADDTLRLSGGSTTLNLDSRALEKLGLRIEAVADRASPPAAASSCKLAIDPASDFLVSPDGNGEPAILGGTLRHRGRLLIHTSQTAYSLPHPVLRRSLGPSLDVVWSLCGENDEPGLLLGRMKIGFDVEGTLAFHSPDLMLSPELRDLLRIPGTGQTVIGTITVRTGSSGVTGKPPPHEKPAAQSGRSAQASGADMTFCQLYQLSQYGRLGDIVGLAVGTTSWNIGGKDLMWYASPDSRHPFIVMNFYRLKADRFEQIGQSAIKHGFYALGNTQCGGACTYESGHFQGDWLGVGCTDTYSSSLNAEQNGLAPRAEVNPWTGAWSYAGSHFSQGYHSHNAIQHRLQVHDADLDPAQNGGATYYVEGYYAISDDTNVMNSASWKPATVSGAVGGTWTFGVSGAATPPTVGFAIDAWTGGTKTTLAQEVPPVEFVSPDGRCVLAAKATDLGGGTWHYEYALLNIDMDRKVGSFSIQAAPWITVTNIGFHAVDTHDEPYSNTAWTSGVSGGRVTWSTTNNPIQWGTLYNFRFDAAAGPISNAAVTLGMYTPGTPTSVAGTTVGPDAPLTGNAIRGGLLWDTWWDVNGAPQPGGNHPLYPPIGQQSGSVTFRCKECHGWDYKGASGAYATGSHYTGIRGVWGSTKTASEKFEIIKNTTPPNGHGYANYGLTDADILDLLQFMQERLINTSTFINGNGEFLGDVGLGEINYQSGGWISCLACHGDNGAVINFGTPQNPEWVGTVAVRDPWKLMHKIRFGQPGVPMPSWLSWNGTDQGAADLGRYCQVSLPVDCLDNSYCAAGDPCNRMHMCSGGRCIASTLDGDFNHDGVADGNDIQTLVDAVMANSSDPAILARGDFSGDGAMSADDIPCAVSAFLAP